MGGGGRVVVVDGAVVVEDAGGGVVVALRGAVVEVVVVVDERGVVGFVVVVDAADGEAEYDESSFTGSFGEASDVDELLGDVVVVEVPGESGDLDRRRTEAEYIEFVSPLEPGVRVEERTGVGPAHSRDGVLRGWGDLEVPVDLDRLDEATVDDRALRGRDRVRRRPLRGACCRCRPGVVGRLRATRQDHGQCQQGQRDQLRRRTRTEQGAASTIADRSAGGHPYSLAASDAAWAVQWAGRAVRTASS